MTRRGGTLLAVVAHVVVGASLVAAPVGAGPAKTEVDPATYRQLVIEDAPVATGVFDGAVVFPGDEQRGWMAYSLPDYHADSEGRRVQDVATAIATTRDGGRTWRHLEVVNPARDVTVTSVVGPGPCGAPRCTGRLIAEVPFLVHDPSDPSRARRWKLFAVRYLWYPPGPTTSNNHLGVITLRTAQRPNGPWSEERSVYGWRRTPPELRAALDLNSVAPEVADCVAFTEGDAMVIGRRLDLVLACAAPGAGGIEMRAVLFRSNDHGRTLRYVSTLLEGGDAEVVGADGFNAFDLAARHDEQFLLASPIRGRGQYRGCVLISFTDRTRGELAHEDGKLAVQTVLPTLGGRFGGACSGDRAGTIVMSQLFLDAAPQQPFRLYDTGVSPRGSS